MKNTAIKWWYRVFRGLSGRARRRLPGVFQPYNYTLPDRYPWLFQFAVQALGAQPRPRLLSFGCSVGDEVFALCRYFPAADVKGIDIDPCNVEACRARSKSGAGTPVEFDCAATTAGEPTATYDAIFCLAVLVLGDLTTSGAVYCNPQLRFADFEDMVTDFSRCLKPNGVLFLHTTNFRFSDTTEARHFDVILEAEPEQMAPDAQFGRDDRLLPEPRYRAVGFRKRNAASPAL
jgi:2-polyprenyl-3-methyl-5-hydroxy-6-metoxy-1,4-benzoquinol methylase